MRIEFTRRNFDVSLDEQIRELKKNPLVKHVHEDNNILTIYLGEWTDEEVSCEME